jgi:hypothetical protein
VHASLPIASRRVGNGRRGLRRSSELAAFAAPVSFPFDGADEPQRDRVAHIRAH